ncbi:MAG TPA: hypothetical protein VM223_24450 [Planctomycetota bacterium]|nr:hypothetical protein [Planctomycetota bacterium]
MSYLTVFPSTNYGGMKITGDAAQSVPEASVDQAIYGGATGAVSNFTFTAGATVDITAYADGGGGKVTCTTAGHTFVNGDYIAITNTTNYNGVFIVSGVDGATFQITDTFNGDDEQGTARRGDRLVAAAGAGGTYIMGFSVSTSEGGAAGSTVEYSGYINATQQGQALCRRKYANNDVGNCGATGTLTLAVGDHVWFAMQSSGTNAITIEKANVVIHRIE